MGEFEMTNNKLILAIETSCDETSVSVIKNGTELLSNTVLSQIDSHKRFGGVVPEVASRHHVEGITATIDESLVSAKVKMEDIDAIAVTQGPGLIGALLIGINAAKALAFAYDKPIIPVHHIAGHIYANHLEQPLTFPLMSLIVSGGHTELVNMKNHLDFEVIGETRDDAVGEAYDKVARTINLPYPGGPHIDRLAAKGKDVYDFPRVWLEKDSYDFVATSFQNSVVEVLTYKAIHACKTYNVNRLIVAGGVASNKGLRNALSEACKKEGIHLTIPSPVLCTDNAAMIGAAGYYLYQAGLRGDLALNGQNNIDIETFSV